MASKFLDICFPFYLDDLVKPVLSGRRGFSATMAAIKSGQTENYYIMEEKNLSPKGTIFQMKPWIKHIRDLMKERGMTQEALACQLGKGQSWVNHKLSGRRKANVEDIVIIANALDIEPSTLLKNVTNYEKLTDSFMGVAEPEGTYQADWLVKLSAGLQQLDDKTRTKFMKETLGSLERLKHKGIKKGS